MAKLTFTDPFGLCKWHEMACWNDRILAAGANGGALKRFGTAAASLALELTGAVAVDEHARDAAAGSTAAAAFLVLDIASNAIPGGGQGKAALSRLIRDATENPGAWRTVAAFVETAVSKKARGGASIQRVIQNEAGDQLVEHTLLDKSGKVLEQHFRDNLKFVEP